MLFRLDATDYRLAVKAAEADLAAAEAEVVQSAAEHDRQLRSSGSGVGSSSDLDKARSAQDVAVGRRDRAKEALTLARNRLSYCDLTADADGVITALPAEAGQVVAEGQVVARLARDGEREAVISLPENQAIAAKAARATVTLWSAPGESFPAALRELSPVADPVTRTYQARFTIQNPGTEGGTRHDRDGPPDPVRRRHRVQPPAVVAAPHRRPTGRLGRGPRDRKAHARPGRGAGVPARNGGPLRRGEARATGGHGGSPEARRRR